MGIESFDVFDILLYPVFIIGPTMVGPGEKSQKAGKR